MSDTDVVVGYKALASLLPFTARALKIKESRGQLSLSRLPNRGCQRVFRLAEVLALANEIRAKEALKFDPDYVFSKLPHSGKTLRHVLENYWEAHGAGCRNWAGQRDQRGYGKLYHKGKVHLVHRLVVEVLLGTGTDGLVVRHTCDNPSCINPNHLLVGTQADNMADMAQRGRGRGIAMSVPPKPRYIEIKIPIVTVMEKSN